MNDEQKAVREFHEMTGVYTSPYPMFPEQKHIDLRFRLIDEETTELLDAIQNRNLVEIADALGDLLYVVYGAGLAFGIDLDPIFKEIHRSNMTKKNGWKNSDGKWIKPVDYEPAMLLPILLDQGMAPPES